jgi:hypothetical protein
LQTKSFKCITMITILTILTIYILYRIHEKRAKKRGYHTRVPGITDIGKGIEFIDYDEK